MQNKQKADKESRQKNFYINACLPTEIDILLPEYEAHSLYTITIFLTLIIWTTLLLIKYVKYRIFFIVQAL